MALLNKLVQFGQKCWLKKGIIEKMSYEHQDFESVDDRSLS